MSAVVELLADEENDKVPEHLKGAFAVLRRGIRESPELRTGLGFTVIVSLGVTVATLVTPVLVQQVFDLLRVVPQKHGLRRRVLGPGAVEANFHRGINFLQNGFRSRRKREGFLLRQIDALLERCRDHVEAAQQKEHHRHTDRRVKDCL